MINANELRVGNYIYEIFDSPISEKDKRVIIINSINGNYGTIITLDDNITQLDYCEPIPITPEVLEKCGLYYCMKGTCSERFKYQEGYWVLISSTIYLKDGGDGFSVETITYSHEECTEISVIKYLHQLQNLYFALTGEELAYTN